MSKPLYLHTFAVQPTDTITFSEPAAVVGTFYVNGLLPPSYSCASADSRALYDGGPAALEYIPGLAPELTVVRILPNRYPYYILVATERAARPVFRIASPPVLVTKIVSQGRSMFYGVDSACYMLFFDNGRTFVYALNPEYPHTVKVGTDYNDLEAKGYSQVYEEFGVTA